MTQLERLAGCAGRWQGSNRLHDPHTGRPEDSASTAVLATLLGGRFLRLDYTWSYQGTPQEGSLLVGFQSGPGKATVHWIDSWHMADAVLACEGAVEPDGTIAVRGSYAVAARTGLGLADRDSTRRRVGARDRHAQRHPRRRGSGGGGGDVQARGLVGAW